MEIFLNVPEEFREFKNLNSNKDNNPLLKIKEKRHAKKPCYFKNQSHHYFHSLLEIYYCFLMKYLHYFLLDKITLKQLFPLEVLVDFLIKGSCFGFCSSVTILTLQVILGKIYVPAKTMINIFKASDMDIFKQGYLMYRFDHWIFRASSLSLTAMPQAQT